MMTCAGFNLSSASYRGASFWVRNDKEEHGRRIVTHEYPMRDEPYNEDLGLRARKFSVTGYVVGNNAVAMKEAVVAACSARGSALLQLPANTAIMAVCLSLSVTRSKDEQGIFELNMEFIADISMGGMPMPISIFETMISIAMMAAVPAVTAHVTSSFSTQNTLPYVEANAVARVVAFSTAVISALEALPVINSEVQASLVTSAISLAQNAETIVTPLPGSATTADAITTIATIFNKMGQITAANDTLGVFKSFSTFAPYEPLDADGYAQYDVLGFLIGYDGTGDLAKVASPSENADNRNAAAFNGMVRAFALMAFAQSVAAATFPNRAAAIQARADLVELFDQQIERTTDEAVEAALVRVRDYAVQAVTKNMLNLIPVVTVTSPISLPALYWAARLYDDAERAEELAVRNQAAMPAFMPQQFEATVQ